MRITRVSHRDRIAFAAIEEGFARPLAAPPIGEEIELTAEKIPLDQCRLLAPTLPSKIIALGLNYRDHAEEVGMDLPAEPLLFMKPSTAVVGPGDPIRKPPQCERLDYEGELAVVVRGLVRNADEEAAARSILGYTCGNDVTARDLQAKDMQWTRAKGFDSFCPLGPWIDTEVDPLGLDLETRVNGDVRQRSSTKNLIFSPAAIVSYVSRVMTLLPGDVILTGTPSGIGPMEPGDTVAVEISGIGTLENPVVS